MIDAARDNLITLAEAAALIPAAPGRPVHVSTLARWAKHGKRGVILETVEGQRVLTTAAAVAEFLERLAVARVKAKPAIATPGQQRRRSERVHRPLLDWLGIKESA